MQSEGNTLKIKSWDTKALKCFTDFFSPVEVKFCMVLKKTALSSLIERVRVGSVHITPSFMLGFMVVELPVLGHLTVRNLEEILHKNGAIIFPLNKEGDVVEKEKIGIVYVENDTDNLPDHFLFTSDGKYRNLNYFLQDV